MRLIAFAIVILSGALVMASTGLMDNNQDQRSQRVFGVFVMLIGGGLMLADLFVNGFSAEVKNFMNQQQPTEPVERHPEA